MKKFDDIVFCAFDTETSGAYPLSSEIVEIGLIKWRGSEILGEFGSLYKPSVPMTDFIIGIHGITNQMVENCEPISCDVAKIMEFIGDSVLVAHHAPFDVGFLTWEIEKAGLPIPRSPILCSSLLARKWITNTPNHKLQTLIKVLKLDGGTAHRALDDAKACRQVFLKCLEQVGADMDFASLQKSQGKKLEWSEYQIKSVMSSPLRDIREAILGKKQMDIVYDGGSLRGKPRRIEPIGIVRNPDGDFVMAVCQIDKAQKRFYLDKIKDQTVVY